MLYDVSVGLDLWIVRQIEVSLDLLPDDVTIAIQMRLSLVAGPRCKYGV